MISEFKMGQTERFIEVTMLDIRKSFRQTVV